MRKPQKRQSDYDELVPDPQVCREFKITAMTLWRWERDPRLNFPPKIKIRTRNYRSRKALNDFRDRLISEALKRRGAIGC
jgi:hypothetical protein